MRLTTLEAYCSGCNLYFYSTAFNEQCDHYCPACGVPLVITGRAVYMLRDVEYHEYRKFRYNRSYRLKIK